MPEFITFASENIQFQKRKEHFLTPVCFKPQQKFTISQNYGFLSLLITCEQETVYKSGSGLRQYQKLCLKELALGLCIYFKQT